MSDEHIDQPRHDAGAEPAHPGTTPGLRAGAATRQAGRRPRPSAAYTADRRASLASRRRAPVEPSPQRRWLILPIVVVIVVLVAVLAVIGDRAHMLPGSAAAPTKTATPAPSPTVAPTATPVPVTPPPTTRSGVAAAVNGEVVPMDLYATIVRADANGMQLGGTDPTTGAPIAPVDVTKPAGLKELHQHERDDLNQLIQTAAAVAYAKQHHLVATAKQVQDALNSLYAQYGGKVTFLQQVKGEGYTESAITKIVTDGTTEQNVFAKIGKQAPADGKTVRHIVIGAKNKALADKLAKQLQADHGSNFAALAKKYSTDTQTASSGGNLGVVTKGQLDAAVNKVVFSLKTGQISDPVKASDGWEIVQVLGPGASQTAQGTYFTSWLTKQQAQATIYVKIPNP